jgi:hypothetical protein
MAPTTHGPLRAVLVAAVRQLAADARAARAEFGFRDVERQFYLGVEAAADEVLHPELGETRSAEWPASEPPLFREGYLRTTAMLATAMTGDDVPTRLRLPAADPR